MKQSYGFVLLVVCISVVSVLSAQPQTMSGFVAGAVTQENTFSVLGQPFVGTSEGSGYQVTEGIAQSQLVREEYTATVNYSAGYNDHGFSYPWNTPVGVYNDYLYYVHDAQYHYDFVKVLNLEVVAIPCGDDVYDVDLNSYPTVAVAGYCWTKKNLKVEHFPDGVTLIPGAMVYNGSLYNDEVANLSTYGRLYTWYSAVNVPENGNALPVSDGNGYVRGICPDGWHIPSVIEASALLALGASVIKSTDFWVEPNDNTNVTGFTALPAGSYKSALSRFEGLHSWTGFWTAVGTVANTTGTALQIPYYCDTPSIGDMSSTDAISIRCVKNS